MREVEVDQLLAAWDERLRRVDENLIALEAEPTYQMLAGGARATLKGRTCERVVPALDALGELFDNRERLNAVVLRAKELRADLSFWNKDEKLATIVALLTGPSITLGTRQMPVAQRNLLDAATSDVAVVPENLLAEMVHAYQVARDAVAEVASAWSQVEPRLIELEQEVAEAQKEAAALGQAEPTRAALERIVADLARVRTLVSTDPLAALGHVDVALAPELLALRTTLRELATQEANVKRGLADARAMLDRIAEATGMADASARRAAEDFAGFAAKLPDGTARHEVAEGLAPWLEKIAGAASLAHWRAAEVGLTRWVDVARGVLDGEVAVAQLAQTAGAQRTELEGRLSARRAQAMALAARGRVAPPELEALARDAEASLRARPTHLETAQREVEQYEAAVRAFGAHEPLP